MVSTPEPANLETEPSHFILHVERTRYEGTVALSYVLRSSSEELRCRQTLDADPFEYFKKLFERVEAIDWSSSSSGEAQGVAVQQISGIGATLADRLLPANLRRRLLAAYDPERGEDAAAPSLWVISDEPWIPWELLRLRDTQGVGPHLGEAFAVSRWLWERPVPRKFPLDRIGLVVPDPIGLGLVASEGEGRYVRALQQEGVRQVEPVSARLSPLLEAFAADRYSAWHFAGHGWTADDQADFWGLGLEGDECLEANNLRASGCDLSGQRPFIFLNACQSAKMHLSLSGFGGLAEAFLEAGAGALLGTHWSVDDTKSWMFAKSFYTFLLAGDTFGNACRRARLRLRDAFPGDAAWLAYTLFAHPDAAVDGVAEPVPPVRHEAPHVRVRRFSWNPDTSPPGTLLRADHGIVRFHSRDVELDDLLAWCCNGTAVQGRLYTGRGGMGKTRLALELCDVMRRRGWRSGFIQSSADDAPEASARAMAEVGGPSLMVLDYAETRRDLLVPLLRRILDAQNDGPFRLILLSRSHQHWWSQLRMEPDGVGDWIAGPAAEHLVLRPLALSADERASAYGIAARAFARRLGKPVPQRLPDDLEAAYFEPVLMLHMSALGAVEGEFLQGEDNILDWVLDRERRFWRNQLEKRDFGTRFLSGVGRAMCAVYLAGGTMSEGGTVRLLQALDFFHDQPQANLVDIARLMHAIYPGDRWVMPVQPDILGEHLLERELEVDPQEIFDLIANASTF